MRLALIAMLMLASCRQPAAGPAPEYHPEKAGTADQALCLLGFTAVAVREVGTGHHLIEATINGREGEFVLDTGANMTVIDLGYAQRFGIAPGSGAIGGALGVGGGGQARRSLVKSFRFGPVQVRQNRVLTADLGQLLRTLGQVSGTTVYGIVGQDVLKEHRAIIDVARPMLYLMEADRDPAPVPAERCKGSTRPV
jgi:predicted aspartyl protease